MSDGRIPQPENWPPGWQRYLQSRILLALFAFAALISSALDVTSGLYTEALISAGLLTSLALAVFVLTLMTRGRSTVNVEHGSIGTTFMPDRNVSRLGLVSLALFVVTSSVLSRLLLRLLATLATLALLHRRTENILVVHSCLLGSLGGQIQRLVDRGRGGLVLAIEVIVANNLALLLALLFVLLQRSHQAAAASFLLLIVSGVGGFRIGVSLRDGVDSLAETLVPVVAGGLLSLLSFGCHDCSLTSLKTSKLEVEVKY